MYIASSEKYTPFDIASTVKALGGDYHLTYIDMSTRNSPDCAFIISRFFSQPKSHHRGAAIIEFSESWCHVQASSNTGPPIVYRCRLNSAVPQSSDLVDVSGVVEYTGVVGNVVAGIREIKVKSWVIDALECALNWLQHPEDYQRNPFLNLEAKHFSK